MNCDKLSDLVVEKRTKEFAFVVEKTVCTYENKEEVVLEKGMEDLVSALMTVRETKNQLYVVGNGGSAAVASHIVVDLVNVGKIGAMVLHEPSIFSCMSNDFGYENAYQRLMNTFIRKNDMLIAISSSGKSNNIINAALAAKEAGAKVVTLSGFGPDNPLRSLGHLNFWINSKDYCLVEVGHLFLLHNISDRIGAVVKA